MTSLLKREGYKLILKLIAIGVMLVGMFIFYPMMEMRRRAVK